MRLSVFIKTVILAFFACFYTRCMSAQDELPDHFIVMSFDEMYTGYSRYIDSTCVDTSYINVVYRHVYRKDEDISVLPRCNYDTLFVGKENTLFLGFKGRFINKPKVITDNAEVEKINQESSAKYLKEVEAGILSEHSLFYLWILKDNISLKETVAVNDYWYSDNNPNPFSVSESLTNFYDEPFPEFSWEITGDTAEVFGYDCIRAECDFRGRHWTAWFAPEIAVNEGPWKLRGLPGLILKAEADGGWFTYECVGIDTEPRPIYRYHYDNERTMKYKRYMKYERHCFEDAIYILWDLLLPMMRDDLVKGGGGSFPYYPMEYLPGKNKSGKRAK